MVFFALPGLAFHGAGWLTCKDEGLVLLLGQGMKGAPRKAFMAITQRCNLLRSVANALFTQKLHANFTSGLMYFHGRDRLRRRVFLLCCLQATSHFVSYDR